MRALVVYESMFGNTAQVADAVALGLGEGGAEVAAIRIGTAGDHDLVGRDLLVLGGPTHALAMSRPASRADAVARGADGAVSRTGVREWLDALGSDPGPVGHPVAAVFDTRARVARHWPGSAARGMARALRARGIEVPEHASFYVDGVEGPVLTGELERARDWGRHLAATPTRLGPSAPGPTSRQDLGEGAPSW